MSTTVPAPQAHGLAPIALGDRAGEAHWFFGGLYTLKATGAETGGAMTIFEVLAGAEAGPPLHVHEHEDEAFFVLEGAIDLLVDGTITRLGPGGFGFGPRRVPHTWAAVSDGPARMLAVVTPCGFEDFVVPSDSRRPSSSCRRRPTPRPTWPPRQRPPRRPASGSRPAASNLLKLVVGPDPGFPGPGARAIKSADGAPTRGASADVAQLVEHFTRNEGVRGSNPRVGFTK